MEGWIDEFPKPVRHRFSLLSPAPSVLTISLHFSPASPTPSGLSLSRFTSSRLNHCWGPCTARPQMWPGPLPLLPISYSAKGAKPWESDPLSTTLTPRKSVGLPLLSPWAGGYPRRILLPLPPSWKIEFSFLLSPVYPNPTCRLSLFFHWGVLFP